MISIEERMLLVEFEPLFQAEYRRMGLTPEESLLVNSGWGGGPVTRDALLRILGNLRAEPDGIGIRRYFAKFGIDYDEMTRPLGPDD